MFAMLILTPLWKRHILLGVALASVTLTVGCNRAISPTMPSGEQRAMTTPAGHSPAPTSRVPAAEPRVEQPSHESDQAAHPTTSAENSRPESAQQEQNGGSDSPAAAMPFNLFAPPKIDLPVVRQNDVRQEDEPVRLIGFVDVGRLKALLAFNGKLRGMEVGEVYNNVEVLAIDPPRVTLQRGKQRWITALFDQPVVHQEASGSTGTQASPQVTVGATTSGTVPPFFAPFAPGSPTNHARQLRTGNTRPGGNIPQLPGESSGQLPQPPGLDQLPMPVLPELPQPPQLPPNPSQNSR